MKTRLLVDPRSKYGNRRVEVDNLIFDSKAEVREWLKLRLMEHCGAIQDLRRQVPYVLLEKAPGRRAVTYVADFVFVEDGRRVVVEVKGARTAVWRIKEKLFRVKFPQIELRVVDA